MTASKQETSHLIVFEAEMQLSKARANNQTKSLHERVMDAFLKLWDVYSMSNEQCNSVAHSF